MSRPKGSAEVIEARRHQALHLLEAGFSLNEIGRILEVAPSSVMRWGDAWESGGEEAMKVHSSPGRPTTLSNRQRWKIVRLLLKGAMANGFNTELWTTRRVGSLIEQQYGVRYHRSHVAGLLHDLGFSFQRLERRALERDEHKIEEWKRKRWSPVKKTLRGWVPTSALQTNPTS